jgi:hypothetical protein
VQKCAVHRHEALVADRQPAVAREPGKGSFHDPAVTPQVVLELDAFPRDPVLDAQACEIEWRPDRVLVYAAVGPEAPTLAVYDGDRRLP